MGAVAAPECETARSCCRDCVEGPRNDNEEGDEADMEEKRDLSDVPTYVKAGWEHMFGLLRAVVPVRMSGWEADWL